MLYILLYRLVGIYELAIIAWCVMSWIPRTRNNIIETIRDFLGTICEPYLAIFKRFIPPFSGIDFSPIVALLVLELVQRYVLPIILF